MRMHTRTILTNHHSVAINGETGGQVRLKISGKYRGKKERLDIRMAGAQAMDLGNVLVAYATIVRNIKTR